MEINKIIELIGGYKALSEILNVSKSAISNYKKRGKLPSYAIPIIVKELKSKGISIDLSEFTKVKQSTNTKTILMIICGGISAYKSPEIIRRLKESGFRVIPVITKGGSKFITPLTLSSVAEEKCYFDLFNLTDESEMGHIKLARIADLILIAPASANFISKVANGMSDDLATTIILATKAPIYICPAMNPSMWSNDIMKNNVQSLEYRGFQFIGPDEGLSACGEFGYSRLSETSNIIDFITKKSDKKKVLYLKNKKVLVEEYNEIEFDRNKKEESKIEIPLKTEISPIQTLSEHTTESHTFTPNIIKNEIWDLPSDNLLQDIKSEKENTEDINRKKKLIVKTLLEHGIEVSVDQVKSGPSVTMYGLSPGYGNSKRVRVDHILAREKDIALALANQNIRFQSPMPGESLVGIEVPNQKTTVVGLKELISEANEGVINNLSLPIALGTGSDNMSLYCDLTKLPHLLVAGATGSGKSVCINSIITGFLMKMNPDEIRFVMIDPKSCLLYTSDAADE